MQRMRPYPMLLQPILVPRVWGGRSLEALGKQLPPNLSIGESWELADLPDSIPHGRSIIANGSLAGQTLRDAIARHHDEIMGDARLTPEGGFPLLIKYLDAREHLSVQVHPSLAYAAQHREAHVKSEAWIIVKAEPGAVIYKGLKPHITREQFAAHIHSGDVIDDLVAVEAREGDCHYLPSGTCHALGAGIVVAEVQTPSDTTFRVFDWGRPAISGRELHIEQALQCIAFGQPHDPHNPHIPNQTATLRITSKCKTEYFEIHCIEAIRDADIPIETSGLPEVWMMISGGGEIRASGSEMVDVVTGSTVLIPADLNEGLWRVQRGSKLLRIQLPSQLEGKIA